MCRVWSKYSLLGYSKLSLILTKLNGFYRLILLVIEAGIDIDMSVMKLVGTRGLIIAVIGSFLPIGVGVLIAWALKVGDWKARIAAGSVFGPTSLGIALNVLKGGKKHIMNSFNVTVTMILTPRTMVANLELYHFSSFPFLLDFFLKAGF